MIKVKQAMLVEGYEASISNTKMGCRIREPKNEESQLEGVTRAVSDMSQKVCMSGSTATLSYQVIVLLLK